MVPFREDGAKKNPKAAILNPLRLVSQTWLQDIFSANLKVWEIPLSIAPVPPSQVLQKTPWTPKRWWFLRTHLVKHAHRTSFITDVRTECPSAIDDTSRCTQNDWTFKSAVSKGLLSSPILLHVLDMNILYANLVNLTQWTRGNRAFDNWSSLESETKRLGQNQRAFFWYSGTLTLLITQ